MTDPFPSREQARRPGQFQQMYPTARDIADNPLGEEDEFVRLDRMTAEDLSANLVRMRAEAAALLRHADELEAWAKERQS